MPKRNKQYIIFIFEIIYILLLFLIIPTLVLREKPGIFESSLKNTLALDINHSYTQKFIADRKNLNSVSVLLKNSNHESIDFVNLEILNKNKDSLQQLRISGFGIEDPGWVKFKFPPISSVKGDIFYIKITSNSPENELLHLYGDSNTKNINFKTTYYSKNLIDSFSDNLSTQIINFQSRNIFQTAFYLILILLFNIIYFK